MPARRARHLVGDVRSARHYPSSITVTAQKAPATRADGAHRRAPRSRPAIATELRAFRHKVTHHWLLLIALQRAYRYDLVVSVSRLSCRLIAWTASAGASAEGSHGVTQTRRGWPRSQIRIYCVGQHLVLVAGARSRVRRHRSECIRHETCGLTDEPVAAQSDVISMGARHVGPRTATLPGAVHPLLAVGLLLLVQLNIAPHLCVSSARQWLKTNISSSAPRTRHTSAAASPSAWIRQLRRVFTPEDLPRRRPPSSGIEPRGARDRASCPGALTRQPVRQRASSRAGEKRRIVMCGHRSGSGASTT